MFQGFYGLLTVMLCMLFAVVATLFNIAPITYMVFGIAIVLSVLLQYVALRNELYLKEPIIDWLVVCLLS